ncbi:MAG: TonB-dependent receptor plug domain-containing protein [Bacteroidota bacterium]
MLNKQIQLLCFLLLPFSLLAQMTITVVDEDNQPLIGAAVYTADQKVANVTDLDGQLELPKLADNKKLIINYLGYEEKVLTWQELQIQTTIQLLPTANDLLEVIVIGRKNERAERLPYQIDRITDKDIAFTQPSTSADALGDHAGVFIQKSQGGGGSPILRGFEANKVLMVVDGVRMNNAIYRSGHLQNAITVDPAMLEQMEVIYGPGSLTYGSDALGGVIHFRTKTPQFSTTPKGDWNSQFFTRYATANNEKAVHFDVNYGSQRWASWSSVTYSRFGDIRAGDNYQNFPEGFGERPFYVQSRIENEELIGEVIENDDPNVQIGTAYDQVDFLQKLRFQLNSFTDLTANIQYSTSSDVPRYDQLTRLSSGDPRDLRFAEWYYGPQDRFLASLTTSVTKPTPFYDRALLITAFQKIAEERFDRRVERVERAFQLEDVSVVSATLDLDKVLHRNGRHRLSYGLDWNFNDVQSEAGVENLLDNSISRTEPTRYPSGGSRMNVFAAYASYKWNSRDSIQYLEAGLRYSYVNTFSLFGVDDPIQWSSDFYTNGVRNQDEQVTWGIGWTALTPGGWQLRASAASAFRAPNLDDFSKIRVNGGFVTIPNPNLTSERTINGELTIGKVNTFGNTRLQLNGTAFYTYLQDAIIRTDFALSDGSFTLLLNDELLNTVANVNADNAYVYGAAANLKANFSDVWRFQTNLNWTRGRRFLPYENREVAVPLAHIPPLYGRAALRYQKNKWQLEGVLRFQGEKPVEEYAVTSISSESMSNDLIFNRLGSSDNLDETPLCADGTFCIGTPAWMTYNLYAQYNFGKLNARIGLENMMDVHYRPFASGVSAAGRNLVIGVSGLF